MTKKIFFILIITAIFLISGCTSSETELNNELVQDSIINENYYRTEMLITKNTIQPNLVTLNKGESVIFANNDLEPLRIYSPNELNYNLARNVKIVHIFENKGEFDIFVGDSLRAIVIVE